MLPDHTKYLMDDVDRPAATGTCCRRSRWRSAPRRSSSRPRRSRYSQVLGVAAQRAITEMRKDVEAHVMRLPVRYFDSTKTGVLISRIMTDAEGIRNLVGTGLVQLTGSIVTAVLALGVLFYLNWQLTAVTILVLGTFGGGMAIGVQAAAAALPRARQDQRRGDRPARRNARRRPHRQGLHGREARGAGVRARARTGCSATSRKSLTGVSAVGAFSTLVLGAIGIVDDAGRRRRRSARAR